MYKYQYPVGYFTGKDLALKAIYFERKLELAMEGGRFFDIVRWGLRNRLHWPLILPTMAKPSVMW
jgi:hypothetical protein